MKSRRKTRLVGKIITHDMETSKKLFKNCLEDEGFYEGFLGSANEFCEKEGVKKSFVFFGEEQKVIAVDVTPRFSQSFSDNDGELSIGELTCYCMLTGGLLLFITPNGIVRTFNEFLDVFGYDALLRKELVRAVILLSEESRRNKKKLYSPQNKFDTEWLLSKPKSVYELVKLTDNLEKFIDEQMSGEIDLGIFTSKINYKEERFQIWKKGEEEFIAKMLSNNEEYSIRIGTQSS